MNMRIILVSSLAASAFTGAALAYPNGQFWEMPASGVAGTNRAGAEGIWYTGSTQDYGLKCSACHTEGAGLIGVTITPSPAWQVVNGESAYSPGQSYLITLVMTGEHLGNEAGAPGDNDGFTAAFELASGATAGGLDTGNSSSAACQAAWPGVAPTGDAYTYGDCHAVGFIQRPSANQTWDFTWIAPAAGAGDVTFFYGVVDGDTGAESSLGDDTAEGTLLLREGT